MAPTLRMGELIRDLKASLRTRVFDRVGKLPAEVRAAASMSACQLIQHQARWLQARSVLLFAPLREELNIWPLLEAALTQGKEIALPRFQKELGRYIACAVRQLDSDVSVGHWNIREPCAHCREMPLNQLDLILVPGVAFDLHGRRLGRGKGFYDQILAAVSGSRCGIAFDEQVVSEVPVEPHDIPVNCILTPTRWIEL